MAEEFKSLHPNGLNFVSKGMKNGRSVHFCRLNHAKFITIRTPEYKDGMEVEEARALWSNYLRSFQPKKYPTV